MYRIRYTTHYPLAQLPANRAAAARQTLRETTHTSTRPHTFAMLARGALCRLAAEVPKQATHDLSKLTTLVQTARSGFALPIRTLSHAAQLQVRSYATTKAATDSTGTVKKAVKTKAAAGKSVKKTTTTKKAPAKKKAAPKKAKKKAAPKKPARKPKKVLTDEEKEKRALTQLRKLALKEPVSRNQLSAFNVYLAEKVKESDQKSTETLAAVAKTYKDITAAEREVRSTGPRKDCLLTCFLAPQPQDCRGQRSSTG